jgi:hypothetical protein
MDDQQLTGLIRRAQGGDRTAFATLVDGHYDTIHRFAWKWCGHGADADDIAQQACIKLAGSLAQFRFVAAMVAQLIVQGFTLPLVDKFGAGDVAKGWSMTFGIFGGLVAVFCVIAAFCSRERGHSSLQ